MLAIVISTRESVTLITILTTAILIWQGWSLQDYNNEFIVILLDILQIKDLKTTNRDCKKANKQDIRYYSIDSNGQDNIQLPL